VYKRILRGATPPIQRSLFREHLKEDVIRSDNEIYNIEYWATGGGRSLHTG